MRIADRHIVWFALALLVASMAQADNAYWPAWRGPLATGVAPAGNPPTEWSETRNIRWKVELTGDRSNASPIVWGDRLYYQSVVKTDQQGPAAKPSGDGEIGRGGRRPRGAPPAHYYRFNLVCRDRNTGALLWTKTVARAVPGERHHGDHGFASFSPVTDGERIWVNFGSQGLHCLDLDGNVKWSQPLGAYKIRAQFGEAGSLALAGNLVFVVKDHEEQSYMLAFNKDTGEPVWKKERDEPTAWTTPLVARARGKPQVVVTGTTRTRAYDPVNGDVIWTCGGQTLNVVPTPVANDDLVFCTSGFRGNKLQAIKLGRTGDLTGTPAVAWEVDRDTPYVPSPLLYEGRLYVCSGNKEYISCYEAATGKAFYTKQELADLKGVYASPVAAAGRVYFVGRNGVTCVIKSAETLEVLAVNTLDDEIDCTPAIVGDALYMKGKRSLYCIGNAR